MSCGKISFVGAALLLGLVITWTGETKAANAAFGICDPYARQLAMLGISDPRPFDDEPGAVSLLEVAAQNFASGRRQEGEDALLQAANYVSGFDVNLIAEITRNLVAVMHSLGLGGYDREFVERVYLSMKPLAVDRSTYHWSPIYWALGVLEILRDIDPDAAVARVREMPAIIEAAEVCEVEKAFPYFYILQRAGAWLTEGERDRMFDQLETGVSVMPALDHYGFAVQEFSWMQLTLAAIDNGEVQRARRFYERVIEQHRMIIRSQNSEDPRPLLGPRVEALIERLGG